MYAFFCHNKSQNGILHKFIEVDTIFYLIHCYCWVQHNFSLSVSFLVGSSTPNISRKTSNSIHSLDKNPVLTKKASTLSFRIVHLALVV